MNRKIRRTTPFIQSLLALLSLVVATSTCRGEGESAVDYSQLKVIKASVPEAKEGDKSPFFLGGQIEVTVSNLDEYLQINPSKSLQDFVLFLDSRPFVGLAPRRVSIAGEDKDKIIYDLRRIKNDLFSNSQSWDSLLGSPFLYPSYEKTIRVSVGFENRPVASNATARVFVVSTLWGSVGWLIVLVVVGGLVVLARQTNLLRDAGEPVVKDGKTVWKSFSLARVQLAIWFCAVFVSFVFIWAVTGETRSLTPQVLAILGMSTMTFIGSTVMDARNAAKDQQAVIEIETQRIASESKVEAAQAALVAGDKTKTLEVANEISKQDDLKAKVDRIKTLIRDNMVAKSFFEDILSDDYGFSFHRFQLMAWTFIFCAVFLQQVWQGLAMPIFDGNLLTLMGISSTTFVGMKATETKSAPQS